MHSSRTPGKILSLLYMGQDLRDRVTREAESEADVLHSIQTWALEEARRRLEKEGILSDQDEKQ